MALIWTSDLNTGISVIDSQHRQLVDYINQLERAKNIGQVRKVLNLLIEYTISHFAFEESLLEEVGYPYLNAHKRVHALFTRRVQEYDGRLVAGENIVAEIQTLMTNWLVSHIKHDDADYVRSVRRQIDETLDERKNSGWLKRTLGRFF